MVTSATSSACFDACDDVQFQDIIQEAITRWLKIDVVPAVFPAGEPDFLRYTALLRGEF